MRDDHTDEYRPQRGGLRGHRGRGRGRGRGGRGRGDGPFVPFGERPMRDGDEYQQRNEANVRQRTRGGDPGERD